MQLVDTATGGPLGEGLPHPPNMTLIGLAPGREGFVLAGPTSLCLFVPKNLPATSEKAPAASEKVPAALAKVERKPVPGEETLKKTEAMLRESLKDLYAKKAPADRRKLAEAVLKIGLETRTDDDTAQYWLLNEARIVAAEIGDPILANKAIDALDREFAVDGGALRIALLEKSIASVTDTAKLKLLAETCAEMLEDSAEANDYDKAIKLGMLGLSALSRGNLQGGQAGRDFDVRLVQLRRQKEAFEAVKPAFIALAAKPDDEAANLAVGKYRCFGLNHWEEGLPNLAAGSDDGLKKAAALDLGSDAKPMKKGEAWWTWAQSQNEADRAAPLVRARYWYSKAIAEGAGGIDKFTAESRLIISVGASEYRPGLLLEITPMGGLASSTSKKTIRLARTPAVSAADFKGLVGNAINVKLSGMIVPPMAGRYRFVIEGRAITRMSLFPKPDDKLLFAANSLPGNAVKREATIVLPNRPVAILLEATLATTGNNSYPVNSFTVRWFRPGAKSDELIPEDALFHKKSEDATLTEK